LNFRIIELTGKNIVIVEDDLLSIRCYEGILKNTGVDVKYFQTGKEFIDYLGEDNTIIDLVIMDFYIPLIDGIDCVKIFRQERKCTPVIVLTGVSSEQTKTEAYNAGCNEYVLKPVYPAKISFLLEKYLNSNIPTPVSY
jgi:two-component system, cell cycle response regulator DivK